MTAVSLDREEAWSILVHGGAGDVAEDRRPLHVEGCERAAAAGAEVLRQGGSAIDAVQRAVEVLENDPLFNAGTGACLNAKGDLELDASIMKGTLEFGGVCALPPFKNPIAIARRVMEATPHILLAGQGAAAFAIEAGFAPADPSEMITEGQRARLRAAKGIELSTGSTVGAVAKDSAGHVAAATSTGGMVGKRVGRVGDSPIPGAGTYADDHLGACSTTGHGEAMMRVCLAKTALHDEVEPALAMMKTRTHQTGGAILVRPNGKLTLARTTNTMSWASEAASGTKRSGS